VKEAREDEEYSPKKVPGQQSPTRNNYNRTNSNPKNKKDGTFSESENYEKISEDASTIKTLP